MAIDSQEDLPLGMDALDARLGLEKCEIISIAGREVATTPAKVWAMRPACAPIPAREGIAHPRFHSRQQLRLPCPN